MSNEHLLFIDMKQMVREKAIKSQNRLVVTSAMTSPCGSPQYGVQSVLVHVSIAGQASIVSRDNGKLGKSTPESKHLT